MQAQVASPSRKSTNVRTNWSLQLLRAVMRVGSRLAPQLTARAAAQIFLRPTRRHSSEREQAILDRAHRFDFELHGYGKLPAWSWGLGPSVILLHGWGGNAAQMTPFVQPLLDAGFSVVAFDGPGHGAATGRRSSLMALGRALRVLSYRIGGAHGVVAHSGGAAATRYALSTGARIDRAAFVGAPAEWGPYLENFGKLLGLSADVLARMRAHAEDKVGVSMDEVRADLVVDGKLSRLLVLHDRSDREVPSRHGETVASSWPQAELMLTEGLGHRRILADSRVHARVLEIMASESCGQVEERSPLEGALAVG